MRKNRRSEGREAVKMRGNKGREKKLMSVKGRVRKLGVVRGNN